jgi:archaemetzincin
VSEVALWWIGSGAAEAGLLDMVRRRVETEYELPVRLHDSPERPDGAWDARRGQHSSSRILVWLQERRPPGAARVLGLTDADLFIPILTFVFGEAQLAGRTAVVSTARLARSPLRLQKEAIHELGHTFGLLHCRTARCAMGRSASLRDVDAKGSALCPDCHARYRESFDANGDSHEQEEHPNPAGR